MVRLAEEAVLRSRPTVIREDGAAAYKLVPEHQSPHLVLAEIPVVTRYVRL